MFDNPDLVVARVVGDGEAETGPLATGWHSNKFLDPATDGAVPPVLGVDEVLPWPSRNWASAAPQYGGRYRLFN